MLGTARNTYRRRNLPKSLPAWLHIVGVALIVASLFPYISATDDVLRIGQLNEQHNHPYSSQRSANDDLIRLYQTLDAPLLATPRQISFILFFVLLMAAQIMQRIDRSTPFESGRSPPRLAAA